MNQIWFRTTTLRLAWTLMHMHSHYELFESLATTIILQNLSWTLLRLELAPSLGSKYQTTTTVLVVWTLIHTKVYYELYIQNTQKTFFPFL